MEDRDFLTSENVGDDDRFFERAVLLEIRVTFIRGGLPGDIPQVKGRGDL